MKNIGVVILNYLAFEETKKLASQFLLLPRKNVNLKIIIVDNHSNNESYEILKKFFESKSEVLVVKTNKNLGFANGNNLGYSKLKKIMDPDYVIFSNSDIVLKNKTLFEWIIKSDNTYHFGLLGPSVYSLRYGIHQSPCNNWSESLKYNYNLMKKMKLQRLLLYMRYILPKNKRRKLSKNIIKKDINDFKNFSTNKTLHGSFIVMSKKYLTQFNTPFDTGTFLYMEEAIIKVRCERKKILILYSPDYEVDHLQAVSTEKIDSSYLKRQIIRKNNEINSLYRFIQILKNDCFKGRNDQDETI